MAAATQLEQLRAGLAWRKNLDKLFVAVGLTLINLIVDLTYTLLDPRIRY